MCSWSLYPAAASSLSGVLSPALLADDRTSRVARWRKWLRSGALAVTLKLFAPGAGSSRGGGPIRSLIHGSGAEICCRYWSTRRAACFSKFAARISERTRHCLCVLDCKQIRSYRISSIGYGAPLPPKLPRPSLPRL